MSGAVTVRDGVPTLACGALPGGLDDGTLRDAVAAFRQAGCLRLLGAFPTDLLARLRREHERRHRRYFPQAAYLDARIQGDRRTLVTLDVSGPFSDPAFYANPFLLPVARAVLGPDLILGHLAVILTRPGAADQSVHRDTPSLFGDPRVDARMPTVGMGLVLPLEALDADNGGTRVWPGTQDVAGDDEARRMPHVDVCLPLGSCLTFDVRALHGGMANRTRAMRSIVYAAYHRRWFRDRDGFEGQPPVGITRRELARMPAEHRSLLAWRLGCTTGGPIPVGAPRSDA